MLAAGFFPPLNLFNLFLQRNVPVHYKHIYNSSRVEVLVRGVEILSRLFLWGFFVLPAFRQVSSCVSLPPRGSQLTELLSTLPGSSGVHASMGQEGQPQAGVAAVIR